MRPYLIVPLALLATCLEADVVISEFLASNQTIIQDDDFKYSDYIELFNNGTTPADLDGYFLTDTSENLVKWRIPAVSIAAGARLIIFASGENRTKPSGTLHTNFNISKNGEYLGLVAPDGTTIVDEYYPLFPEQYEDIAYGILDGDVEVLSFLTPSPGTANKERYVNVGMPTFSLAHGFYNTPFTLYLGDSTAEATIRYTLDGSVPSIANGQVYDPDTGILIDDTRVLRAIAMVSGFPDSPVATASYIFLNSVVNQSNDQTDRGFPVTWEIKRSDYNGAGKIRPGDYEMDPDVAIEPSDLATVPSISIVLPQEDLWDGNFGIYVNSHKDASSSDFWERACSVEYIDPNSDVTFSVDGGLRIFGGAASHPHLSSKMGFRIVFRSEYGVGRLETGMFERVGPGADKINTIVLRSHWGSSFLRNPDISGWAGETEPWRALYMRDVYANETYRATGHLNQRSMMVHVYLNGLYFGLFEALERPDDSFNAENRGGSDEDYDVIKGDSAFANVNGSLHSGSLDAYRRLTSYFDTSANGTNYSIEMGITDEELVEIGQYMDLPAFCDYMISLWFLNRLDFPNKNWYAAAKRGEPGGPPEQPFVFFTWDSEATLWFDDSFDRKISWDERSVAERWHESTSHDLSQIRFYRRLKKNEKFRQLWADRVYELLFNDGPLNQANNLARWDALGAEIDRAIIGESARWGDWVPRYSANPITHEDWLQEFQLVREYILRGRNDLTIEQMREFGIYPEMDPPNLLNYAGIVWPGEGIRLSPSNSGAAIQYSLDGSDPRYTGTTYSGPVPIEEPVTLKASMTDGENWSALAQETLIPLGGLPLAITELMYHPNQTIGVEIGEEDKLEFIEVTNVGTKTVSLMDLALTDGVQFAFSEGTIHELAAGASVLVVRDKALFTQVYGSAIPVTGEYDGNLANGGERVELSLASFVLQAFTYQDKEPWVEVADGEGNSLELAGFELDPAQPTSWRASPLIGGSPGTWTQVIGTVDPWKSTSEMYGLNWRHEPSFGTYYVYTADLGPGYPSEGLAYHRNHGWLQVFGDTTSSWWYDFKIGWMYTSNAYYPFIYSVKEGAWMYYLMGSSSPRWFYNYGVNSWIRDLDPVQ